MQESYLALAKPAEVIDHLKAAFSSAGVPFQPNSDGIGTSIRANLPECGLVITIREEKSNTRVRVACAVPSAPAGTLPPLLGQASKSPNRFEEDHRRVLAQAEADSRRRTEQMRKFDQPVPAKSVPFYNNDAPPLVWPSWFVHTGTRDPLRPVETKVYSDTVLQSRFRTTTPMTDLYLYYQDLMKANGFRPATSRLGTGQTINGAIIQNAYGSVEGCRSEDGTVNGPHTCLQASFRRSYVNEPITVTLQVKVKGSFGRR
jgi:hypothetical protein